MKHIISTSWALILCKTYTATAYFLPVVSTPNSSYIQCIYSNIYITRIYLNSTLVRQVKIIYECPKPLSTRVVRECVRPALTDGGRETITRDSNVVMFCWHIKQIGETAFTVGHLRVFYLLGESAFCYISAMVRSTATIYALCRECSKYFLCKGISHRRSYTFIR